MSSNVSRGNKPQFLSGRISDAMAKLEIETMLPAMKSTRQMGQKIPIIRRLCNTFLKLWKNNTNSNYLFHFHELLDCCKNRCFMEERVRRERGKEILSVSFISWISQQQTERHKNVALLMEAQRLPMHSSARTELSQSRVSYCLKPEQTEFIDAN